jgi:hypothetical protein
MPDDGERAGEGAAAGVPTFRSSILRRMSASETPEEQALADLIAALEEQLAREDLPDSLRTRVAAGLAWVRDLCDAVHRTNRQLIVELVEGTVRENGTKRPDGLDQIVPLWARGTADLAALQGIVVVDESQEPVTVTVHWERVPRDLRPKAASLASELVDAYYGRPKGGRPKKSSK